MSGDGPVVLLDVDGVVNLGLFLSSAERGRLRWHDGWFIGRAGDRSDPYATRIVLNRKWGPAIRSLADTGAELAWATRWREAANMWIAPLLGLPRLPVVPVSGSAARLKAWDVIPWTQGRPWAWLDDEEDELAMASSLSSKRPHLAVLTDRKTGLADEHAEKVRAWLASL